MPGVVPVRRRASLRSDSGASVNFGARVAGGAGRPFGATAGLDVSRGNSVRPGPEPVVVRGGWQLVVEDTTLAALASRRSTTGRVRRRCGRGVASLGLACETSLTFSSRVTVLRLQDARNLLALLAQLALRADVPVERHRPDAELPAQRGHRRVAVRHRGLGQPHLSFRQRELPPTPAPAGPCGLEPGHALADQLPLELGPRREDAEHEAAGRGRGVDLRPLAGEHSQARAARRQILHGVPTIWMSGSASRPVQRMVVAPVARVLLPGVACGGLAAWGVERAARAACCTRWRDYPRLSSAPPLRCWRRVTNRPRTALRHL